VPGSLSVRGSQQRTLLDLVREQLGYRLAPYLVGIKWDCLIVRGRPSRQGAAMVGGPGTSGDPTAIRGSRKATPQIGAGVSLKTSRPHAELFLVLVFRGLLG